MIQRMHESMTVSNVWFENDVCPLLLVPFWKNKLCYLKMLAMREKCHDYSFTISEDFATMTPFSNGDTSRFLFSLFIAYRQVLMIRSRESTTGPTEIKMTKESDGNQRYR